MHDFPYETQRIAISLGDPAGIGMEVTLKALGLMTRKNIKPILIGCQKNLMITYARLKSQGENYLANPERLEIKDIPCQEKIEPGTFVIFNPPYGERIDLKIDNFYEKIGRALKHKYEGCSIWIISADIENMKFIGLNPSHKIKIMNGKLNCSFRNFEIYKGSKKISKNNIKKDIE